MRLPGAFNHIFLGSPSGPPLVKALVDGLKATESKYVDFGLKTTPQLHYVTRCINDSTYGKPTEDGYYAKISTAYKDLVVCFTECIVIC
jgi:phosphoacetylglucosamine mutase